MAMPGFGVALGHGAAAAIFSGVAGSTWWDSWALEDGGGLRAVQPALRGAREVGMGLWQAPPQAQSPGVPE